MTHRSGAMLPAPPSCLVVPKVASGEGLVGHHQYPSRPFTRKTVSAFHKDDSANLNSYLEPRKIVKPWQQVM